MELTNKQLALLSPFRYTVAKNGSIAIDRLLDTSKEYAVIPEGVTVIRNDAFRDAKSLKKLYLPTTLRYIGETLYWHCPNLEEIHLGSLDAYLRIEFHDFPSKPLRFYENGKLIESYTVPEGTTKIPDYAFAGMGSLTEVILPDGLREIGDYSFAYCGLQKLALPKSLKSFGSYAFWANASLKEVSLPEGITELSYGSFGCCSSLHSISLPKTLTVVGSDSLQYTAIRSLKLPPRVTRIGANACRECHSLTRVTIPESTVSIDNYAFYRCTALSEITMENGLLAIGINAVSHCDALTELSIPRSVKTIAHNAFAGNRSLKKLYLPPYGVTFGQDIVTGCPALREVSTDGYAYVNNTLIKLTPYEKSMGELTMTVDDASYLATMPIPKQINAFRLKILTVREIDGDEVGRSLVIKTLAQGKVDTLLVKGGVIVGAIVDGVTVFLNETKETYHGEDNNGAGTKGMTEYATLMLARMDETAE